ncbi:MAG: DNA polymerase I [Clostridiaceae bacterium]|jgi:DNA polymerase-1|nr:DNA polymerase I [Clostridiaceae bacterium]
MKLLLLDSNSLVNRAFYALGTSASLATRDGRPTGAVLGFMNMLLKLIDEEKPTHIAAAFDLKGPLIRHDIAPDYKGTRKPMPDELRLQIEPLKELLGKMGITVLSLQRYEADDVIGTAAAVAEREGVNTVIVTGDKDCLQLISEKTAVFLTKSGVRELKKYGLEELKEYGFTPESFIDYKALAGDSSDNISGIPGIGEKTARDLLSEFGSLDVILASYEKMTGAKRVKIENGREAALRSKLLATIIRDVPVDIDFKKLAFKAEYGAEFLAGLQALELTGIIKRLKLSTGGAGNAYGAGNTGDIANVYGAGGAVDTGSVDGTDDAGGAGNTGGARTVASRTVELISVSKIEDMMRILSDCDTVALIADGEIRFATDAAREYAVDINLDLFGEGLDYDTAVAALLDAVRGKFVIAFDVKSFMHRGGVETVSGGFFDCMLAAHLAGGSRPMREVEQAVNAYGLRKRAADLFVLRDILSEELVKLNLDGVFRDLETPLIRVLFNMEQRGFTADAGELRELGLKYERELSDLTAEIYRLAGMEFNINSPKQLGETLFEKLWLPHGKKNKSGGYSVDSDILEGLAAAHPVIPSILRYRKISKLKSTYADGLLKLIGADGKIHTSFKQCITTTGRLSSVEPNLQNIPTRNAESKEIRRAFKASEGRILVSADYSQIELRLLAHFSGDESLIDAYNKNADIHALTASEIFNVPLDAVTSTMRKNAKAVNFGIIYGISAFGLSEDLSMPVAAARGFIERYFNTYPRVKEFMNSNIAYAKEHGYVKTFGGRIRSIPEVSSANHNLRSFGERAAMNMPLQGAAADIIKIAMLGIEKRLSGRKSGLILQVHDELIVDAAKDEVELVKDIIREEMEGAVSFRVPLLVNVEVGTEWA